MTFTFDIPDASANDLITGVCAATGWTANSGVAQNDWVRTQAINWFKATAARGLLKNSATSINAQVAAVPIS